MKIPISTISNRLLPLLLRHPIPLPILPLQPNCKTNMSHGSQDNTPQRKAQPKHIFAVMRSLENLTNNKSSAVPDRLVHTDGCCSLVVSRMAVQQPCRVQTENAVNAWRDEKGREIERASNVDWYTNL